MAGKGGSLGELYFSITGEDRLEEILRKNKKLAEEVAKIAGGIQIGRTRVTQDRAREILKEANAFEEAAKGADKFNAAQERLRKKQAAGEFKEYIQDLTRVSDAQRQMTAYYKELEKELGNNQGAIGSIKMLEAELRKLKDTYRSLSETDRNSILGKTMLTQINNADQNLAKINAEMANNSALAKTMGTQYNGLRNQISMVARELPNLGISLSTFIISLSNNLPYLADEIAKANKEFNESKKTSQAATPVWKQMIGAIFNWQTALIVGITVLTTYSREIQAWVQELIKGNSAASILADTQKFLNELHEEAAKGASKELSQLQLLYGVTQDATRTVKERTAATEQLQKLFPDYFGKLSSEAILVGNAQAAYDALAISIKNSEEARRINMENAALNEAEIKAIQERREAEEQLAEAGKELERQRKLPWIINYQGIEDAELAYGHYLEKVERANSKIEGIQESRKKLLESYKSDVVPEFDILFKDMPDVKAFDETLSDLGQKLAMSVIDQEEYNKRVNDAKGVLIAAADAANVGGSALEKLREEYIAFNKIELQKKDKTPYIDSEKQRSEIEKANQILKEAITKAELDIEQTRINLMKDGSEKTLAQIKLDYHKRNAAIEKESKDSLEKVRKLEREQWEKENPNFKKDKLQFTSIIDLTNQLKTLGNQMNETFGKGNVDLLARPLVDAAELAKKGWEDAGDGIATVFSSSFQLNQAGKDVMVHVTPILPDGTVLSSEELEQYIDTTLNDAENILQADNKKNGGLGIVLNVDTDLSDKIAKDFGEGLHLAQEKYYDLAEEIKKNPLSIQVENFQSQQNEQLKQSSDLQEKQTGDLLKSLLLKYQDFATRRKAVEKQFNNDIAILNAKRTDENGEEIDRSVKVANDKMKEALKSITEEENKALANQDNTFLKRLFGDVSEMGFSDLSKLIEQARLLRSYLSGNGDVNGIEFISTDQLKAIEESPAELDKLKKALDRLLSGGKSNSWDNIFEGFTKGLAKLKSAKGFKDVSEGLQDIGASASTASSMLGEVAGDLSSMFDEMGNTEAAEAINGIQDIMNAVSNIGQGFAKGGIIGGIGAAIGEAINFIGKAFAAEARHQTALKEIMNETISQQREYNLLLLQQNLEYEKGSTILGTDVYGKASNAIKVLDQSIKDLNKEIEGTTEQKNANRLSVVERLLGVQEANKELKRMYAGLADIEVKTGHKKTGLFGWGRGKDIYSSIIDVYPELIYSAGKFNKELAETIINTREMSEEDKSALQNMIDLAEQAEQSLQILNDYLTGIFGNFGNTLSDALVDAFANGSDAAKAFTKSVSDMLETLATQMAYYIFIGPELEKAQKEISDLMLNTALSDAEKFEKAGDVVDKATDAIMANQKDYNDWLEARKESAQNKGYEIFEPDKKKKEGLSQSIQGVTEDTANVLGSYLNAIRADVSANRADVSANRVNLQKLVDNAVPFYNDFALHVANLKHLETIAVNTGRNANAADKILDILGSVVSIGNEGRCLKIK